MAKGQEGRGVHPGRAPPRGPANVLGPGERPSGWDWAVGAITVAVFLIGQLIFLDGPHPFDPARYFQTAVHFPDIGADLFTLRVGIIAPVYAAVLIFGPSEAAFYAVPLLAGTALVAVSFTIMLVLFHERTLAAAAALVTGLNVHHLVNSSQLFPDTLATATFSAAVLCLLLAGRRQEQQTEGTRAVTFLLVSSGFLLAWSYLIREFSPILLPVVAALVVAIRIPGRQVALMAAAAFATLLVEPLYGVVGRGEPFVRWSLLVSRTESTDPDKEHRIEYILGRLDEAWDVIVVFPRLLLVWSSGWIFLGLAGLFVAALAVLRDRRLWLFAVWFSCIFVMMVGIGLVSVLSGAWILNIANVRYWYPALPPLVMGGFGGLWLLLRARFQGRRGLLVARLGVLALAAAVLLPGFREYTVCSEKDVWKTDPAGRWHELRSWFLSPEAARFDIVYTDRTSWRLLPAYTASTFGSKRWSGEVETLVPVGGFAPTSGLRTSLLLVHKDRWGASPRVESRWSELGKTWSPVFTSSDGRMVLLAHESTLGWDFVPTAAEWWRTPSIVDPTRPGQCGVSPYEPSA